MEWTGYLRPLQHEVAEPITCFARWGKRTPRLNDGTGRTTCITFLREKLAAIVTTVIVIH
ncbi:hypothetical protein JQC72_16065 [Polycladomyces sp. WAk]|uniref:Uncharacterized protein n=1 Tax=Polycladomyces zharkentensis TaxID=2807616 RepID=A0ABS2WN95_9BACL|nr:hypothetical protein [Polycladomyces sp. WAk]MBN2911008.1 hypothetical protein [Polycladomyces sp. WAk]